MMRNVQKGFTLIELVVVIVILGILAATALPKFIDLTTDASTAASKGFAGAIAGGSSINYAAYLAKRTVTDGSAATVGVTSTLPGCTTAVANALMQSPLPSSPVYTVGPAAAILVNGNATCTLDTPGATQATFVITGAR